ncbi:15588_t:CDS:1 [Racocetra fulgida]|uniref:15588_t:CDS:1 n=1 Tax=Racocetra fulgida TaxID=60492 RepID=A0A9N8WM98_9GLOM|nr:15588_t:CDS:1 [Racocetra fulgida]
MRKFVFLRINDYEKVSDFLGHQRLYIEVNDDGVNDQKIEKIKNFYKNREYIKIEQFYSDQLHELDSDENIDNEEEEFIFIKEDPKDNEGIAEKIIFEKFKKPVGKKFLKEKIEKYDRNKINIPGTKIIAKELIENAKVYANILEIGLVQYITYSHRSRKKVYTHPLQDLPRENKEAKEVKINIKKEDIKKTKVKWIVIPELMESYINRKEHIYKQKLEEEINHCEQIETELNTIEHIDN